MSQTDAALLLPAVAAAAREAGALAMGWFRRGEKTSARVWTKDGDSPVTEADVAIDEMLSQRLGALGAHIGWLSEEAERHPESGSDAPAWIVDPIDGTRGYISGADLWAVSIALVQAGRPQLGCLYLPALDRLLTASAGNGVACNGAPLALTEAAPRIAAGPRPVLDKFMAHVEGFSVHPKIPSLAARIAAVAERQIAIAIASDGAREWDVAAADLIVEEAGGRLTDLHGKPVRYDATPRRHGVLIASCEPDHDSLAQSLGAALANSARP
ncbi:3'(2'),5'-bisphosphate nucleotidase CysQ [Terrarubrum flagellatum]|uniref:3'(2'),5'-bisphosphate nucleotidase CysQ n=1 Tax=Terrirubrum flagellatum TaxID=2895980 RepID=UPI003144F53C